MKHLTCAARVLAFCGASLLAAPSVRAGFMDTSDVVFHYAMDEMGRAPVVHDGSGNGHHAFITNDWQSVRVSGGLMSNEKCFYGFENNQCQVVATNVVANWGRNWSFVCWVRNPDMTSAQNHVIARGACSNSTSPDTYDGCYYNNAWQVWITPEGAMAVQIQNWGGTPNRDSVTGEVLTWESDAWYQIAVVETFYVHDGDTRYRKISVYVTKAGSESIGDPAVEMEWDTAPGYGTGTGPYNLIIGAARNGSYSMPNGYFNGEMRDAWLFTRTLDVSELLADVQAFAPSWHATDDYATFHWNLDETGETPIAVDATGNGYTGVSTNGVQGGFPAPVGTCYGGFKQDVDSLYVDLVSTRCFSDSNRSEVVLWVKKPSPTAANTALLAGNVTEVDSTSRGKDQCWRVFVEESGAVGILMRDWNNHIDRAVGVPYDWGKGWNLVSIKVDLVSRDHLIGSVKNIDDSVVTNYTSGTCSRIRVYAAPAAKAGREGDFTLLAECEGSWTGRFSYGKWLVFGHSGPAWQPEFKPASILGEDGRLGEVAFKTGGWFEFDYLKSRLARYYEPPGLMFIVR